MTTGTAYAHIVKSPGEPARLESHPRTRVAMIVCDHLDRGWSAEEIVAQYPYLTLSEVYSALAYFHDHETEIEAELARERGEFSAVRQAGASSPLQKRLRALKAARGT